MIKFERIFSFFRKIFWIYNWLYFFIYIFDEDTQKELKSPNEKPGSKYCLKHKVNFLVYSFRDNALKKYNNNGEYYSLNGNDYYVEYFIYEKLNIK